VPGPPSRISAVRASGDAASRCCLPTRISVEAWRADPRATDWLAFGARQLLGGVIVGCAVGLAATALVRRLRLPNGSSYAVLALAVAGLSYGAAAAVGSSGFLAVYLTGVLLNRGHRLARSMRTFYEGLAAAQAILFLMLGLLVFPSDLGTEIGGALVIAAFLVPIARPLAVVVCLTPFRFARKDLAIVSWAGLRGAAPIVLATIPLTAGHPHGQLVFDVVFVVVVISVEIQARRSPSSAAASAARRRHAVPSSKCPRSIRSLPTSSK
jgi:cell volume regulation protein A